MTKLDDMQKHILILIDKDKGDDGWTDVSDVVMPFVQKIPSNLVECGKNKCRMTAEGESVFSAMTKWI